MLVLVIDEVFRVPHFGYGATIHPVEPTDELKDDLMRVPVGDTDKVKRGHFVEVDLDQGRAVFRQASDRDPDPVQTAIAIALKYGSIDGDHHKAWVIDQMLRSLAGDRYEELISTDEDEEEWDTGIAP